VKFEIFFEKHRDSGKFISHHVAARFFYKPPRRGSGTVAFFINHRGAAAAAFQPRWTSLHAKYNQNILFSSTKKWQ